MMKCQEFIFLLTSGQLKEGSAVLKSSAFMHRMMCRRCSAFYHNDNTLAHQIDSCKKFLQEKPGDDLNEPDEK